MFSVWCGALQPRRKLPHLLNILHRHSWEKCFFFFLTALASLIEVPQSCQGTERTHGRKWIQEKRQTLLSSLMVLHVKPGTSKGFKKKKSDNPDTAEGSFFLSKGNTLHLVVLFTWVISMDFQRWLSCISFCCKCPNIYPVAIRQYLAYSRFSLAISAWSYYPYSNFPPMCRWQTPGESAASIQLKVEVVWLLIQSGSWLQSMNLTRMIMLPETAGET